MEMFTSPPPMDHFGIDSVGWTKAAYDWLEGWEKRKQPEKPLDKGILFSAFVFADVETQRPPYSMLITRPEDFRAQKRLLNKALGNLRRAESDLHDAGYSAFGENIKHAHFDIIELIDRLEMQWGQDSRGGVDWRARFVAWVCCRVYVRLIGPKFSMGATQQPAENGWDTEYNLPTGDFGKLVYTCLDAAGLEAKWRGPTRYAIEEFRKNPGFILFSE